MGVKETQKSNVVMTYEKEILWGKNMKMRCSGQYHSNTIRSVHKIPSNFLLLHKTTDLFVVGSRLV